ncbi:hypothetical protein H6F87_15720 [Cyanobacteria bacterium FACHB-502]|nr:hypothetical protein [Cyanobacteria bacterium FACHB-502]
MSSENIRNDLQRLVSEIRDILEPISKSVSDEGIRREILLSLGLNPSGSTPALNIPPASLASIDAYRQQAADDVDLQAFISVLSDITRVVQALIDLVAAAATTDSDAPAGFVVEEAVSFYLESIVLGYLRVRNPGVYITASALRLIEEQGIRFGGITQLLFRIGEYFESIGVSIDEMQTDEDAKRASDVILFVLGVAIASLVECEFVYGHDAGLLSESPIADAASNRTLTLKIKGKTKDAEENEVEGSLLLSLVFVPRDHGGVGVLTRIKGDGSLEVPITKNLSFKIDVNGPDFLIYFGDGSLDFPESTDASLGISLIFKSKPPSESEAGEPEEAKEIIWGDPNSIHLRIGSAKLEGEAGVKDQSFKFELKENAFVLATKEADSFLKKMLDAVTSNGKLETEFDFNFGYKKRKWFVGGGMGLMMSLPLHETVLFVKMHTLTVGLAIGETAGEEPGIKLEASLSFGLDLGSLQASVDRIGLAGLLLFESGKFTLGFKPPNGVGLAVDAVAVRGGGFLLFDPDRQEYAGGLELSIALSRLTLTVTAIGLITTRLPDGSDSFSLLAILAVEFSPAFQLGLGFTLNGIGGILGLNRTMRLEAMAAGIKSGAAERILFPRNIVANASRIISDLRAFFPPLNNTFLIGGMLKLGWGTPTLVTLSLGVIIQIPPGTVAILGVLLVQLPTPEAALLQLKVGFLGAFEPDRQRAWFYATLYDSRILQMTLEGGLGVLVAWGNESNFVISVGGFHPQFTPPPLPFPIPDRLAINILNYPLARIRVMAYFAVTSNTVQFGARAELFFGFDSLSLEGHLGLDVLFQFSPFYFIVEISASISLKVFGAGLFSVRLRGSLEGPTPWRLRGAASVSILFFSIDVDVDETWGETVDTVLPGEAVMPLIAGELEKETNWLAELPPGNNLLVSLRKLEAASDALVLHPIGELIVSQRAVPLGVKIDQVGSKQATDANQFTLSVSTSTLAKQGDREELFPMAQFQKLSDTEKLSRPAFQPVPGGLRLAASGKQVRSSRLVKRNVRYETIVIDTEYRRNPIAFFAFWIGLFVHFIAGAAVSKSELSHKHKKDLQPFDDRVAVKSPLFTVANLADNKPVAAEAQQFRSEALAREYLRDRAAANPKQAKAMHVIPFDEANVSR